MLLVAGLSYSQSRFPPLDKSPMDMSYYPPNYPILRIQDNATEPLLARVIYSRPQTNGRNVFGELVEYGKVWRLGANESTEIELFRDLEVQNKLVPKGKYTLYTIPTPEKWTLIFNKDTDNWGAFKYDSSKDLLRVDLPVQKLTEPLDAFSIIFEKTLTGFNLTAAWDNIFVSLPMKVYEKAVRSKKPPVKKR
jgi:Protein of unknown function (DUF2911)